MERDSEKGFGAESDRKRTDSERNGTGPEGIGEDRTRTGPPHPLAALTSRIRREGTAEPLTAIRGPPKRAARIGVWYRRIMTRTKALDSARSDLEDYPPTPLLKSKCGAARVSLNR
jgi:hypothetical protein